MMISWQWVDGYTGGSLHLSHDTDPEGAEGFDEPVLIIRTVGGDTVALLHDQVCELAEAINKIKFLMAPPHNAYGTIINGFGAKVFPAVHPDDAS